MEPAVSWIELLVNTRFLYSGWVLYWPTRLDNASRTLRSILSSSSTIWAYVFFLRLPNKFRNYFLLMSRLFLYWLYQSLRVSASRGQKGWSTSASASERFTHLGWNHPSHSSHPTMKTPCSCGFWQVQNNSILTFFVTLGAAFSASSLSAYLVLLFRTRCPITGAKYQGKALSTRRSFFLQLLQHRHHAPTNRVLEVLPSMISQIRIKQSLLF